MKTVLLTIFQGAVAKNVLRTTIVKTLLAQQDVRVICIVMSPKRATFYRKEIAHERISYDAFYAVPVGRLERVLSFLKFRLIKTATTDLRHRMSYDMHRNYIRYAASVFFNRLIARSSVRKILRFFDYHFIADPGFGALLEKHHPDVVFLTHLFDDAEISLLREARKRMLPTVGFINSWDKLTARCSLRLLPDQLIVFNEIVKQEAVMHADMPEANIAVCGIPQYDTYVTDTPTLRQDFFKKIGIDPARHLILFSPAGIRFSASDWTMIDFLHEVVSGLEGETAAELFVRFPPNDFIDARQLDQRTWLKYILPGVRFGTKWSTDWDMNFDELKLLTDTLVHTSVFVCYSTSIAIDAAIFDKPIIGIGFEIEKNLPLVQSPTQYYKTDHFIKALRPGAMRMVRNKEELVEAIKAYLSDPSLDREGRKQLVKEQCWRLDGKSGERIASEILKKLRN